MLKSNQKKNKLMTTELIKTATFQRTARHIEESELCMVTLPCRYKDKRVLITVEDLG